MPEHPDVLIIGGGVIGVTAAYTLARAGMAVTVLDQGGLGQEASWAGAGIIAPGDPARARTPFDRLRAHSSALYPGLSAELREVTGIDNGYRRCGGLEFIVEHDDVANEWRSEGIAFQAVAGAELRRLEPALAAGAGLAYFLPDMAQVRNPRHLRALVAAGAQHGVQYRPGCAVHGFEQRGGRIVAVQTGAGPLSAGAFLLAAGAWAGPLLEQVGCRARVRPMRGQIVLLNTGTPRLHRVLLHGKRYLVPRDDGRVLIGATEEDVGFDKRTTAEAVAGLLTFGIGMVPELAGVPLERCWAGLRPGSPDGMPYLGLAPGLDNLVVAAGHFRAGIQLSPGTALLIKELLLNQPPTVPLEAFRLDRPPAAPCRPAFRS